MASLITDRLRGAQFSMAIKVPCRVATTGNITLVGLQTIDGVSVVEGDRVLVKSLTNGVENGIYEARSIAWRREPDWDGSREITTGTTVRVNAGLVNPGRWVVTTTGTIIVNTTSVTLEAETIGFSNILSLGAVGDGVANDTSILDAALNGASLVYVPKGRYLHDPITVTHPVHVVAHPEAVFVRRSAVDGEDSLQVAIATNADGSIWEGGVFDGDRVTFGSTYTDITTWWPGLFVGDCTNVTVRKVKFRNHVNWAFVVGTSEGHHISDIDVEDCGKVGVFQYLNNGTLRDIRAKNIGNNGVAMWQHAYEIRNLRRCTVENIRVDGYAPDALGSDPFPVAFALERIFDSKVSGLFLEGYDGTETRNYGVQLSNVQNTSLSDIHVKDAFWGIDFATVVNSTLSNWSTHGGFKTHGSSDGYGIGFRAGGVFQNNGEVVAYDSESNSTSKGLTVLGGSATGHELGAFIAASGITLVGTRCNANRFYGYQIREVVSNDNFNQLLPRIENVELIGCEGRFNGYDGIIGTAGDGVSILGGNYENNGWDNALGDFFRVGIGLIGDTLAGGLNRWTINGPRIGDTQNFTKTNAISFKPGTTDADDRYHVSFIDPDQLYVGQWIDIVNGTGSGGVTARIVDLNLDEATIQCSAPVTFSATGNLVSGTGTISSSGNTVTGSGTAFETQIRGAAWIKVGSDYYHVAKTFSDTSMAIFPAPSPALSGASFEIVLTDIEGRPSQQYGIRADSNVTGPLTILGIQTDGCVTARWSFADASVLDVGSLVALAGIFAHSGHLGINTTDTTYRLNIDQSGGDADALNIAFPSSGAYRIGQFGGTQYIQSVDAHMEVGTASASKVLGLRAGGAQRAVLTAATLAPTTDDGITLGTSSLRYGNGFLSGLNIDALADHADDTAAAGGGVAIGGFYRTASAVKVRVA